MRAIAATGASPTQLGIAFFIAVSLVMCLWAKFATPPDPEGCGTLCYFSFFENISWSLSVLFVFPFVVALTWKYYQEIPDLFAELLRQSTKSEECKKKIEGLYSTLDRRFNCCLVPVSAMAIALLLNGYYFHEILQHDKFQDWITSGEFLKCLSKNERRGFTGIGIYAVIVQTVLSYWVLNLLWRGAAFAWALDQIIEKQKFPIDIRPFHPDRCCGLGRIGDVAMLLNVTLFLLGIYVSLKVIDKSLIQHSPLSEDIGNPLFLVGYLILAPLLFFAPLAAAHERMKEGQRDFLLPLSRKCRRLYKNLSSESARANGWSASDEMVRKAFSDLNSMRRQLRQEIPVWPFDFRSLRAFFATIVVPIFPIVLPPLMKLIFGD